MNPKPPQKTKNINKQPKTIDVEIKITFANDKSDFLPKYCTQYTLGNVNSWLSMTKKVRLPPSVQENVYPYLSSPLLKEKLFYHKKSSFATSKKNNEC